MLSKAVQTTGRYGINYTVSIARTSTEHFWIVVSTSWIVQVSLEVVAWKRVESWDQGADNDRKRRYIERSSRAGKRPVN